MYTYLPQNRIGYSFRILCTSCDCTVDLAVETMIWDSFMKQREEIEKIKSKTLQTVDCYMNLRFISCIYSQQELFLWCGKKVSLVQFCRNLKTTSIIKAFVQCGLLKNF